VLGFVILAVLMGVAFTGFFCMGFTFGQSEGRYVAEPTLDVMKRPEDQFERLDQEAVAAMVARAEAARFGPPSPEATAS
jgi:hypothetical protein